MECSVSPPEFFVILSINPRIGLINTTQSAQLFIYHQFHIQNWNHIAKKQLKMTHFCDEPMVELSMTLFVPTVEARTSTRWRRIWIKPL